MGVLDRRSSSWIGRLLLRFNGLFTHLVINSLRMVPDFLGSDVAFIGSVENNHISTLFGVASIGHEFTYAAQRPASAAPLAASEERNYGRATPTVQTRRESHDAPAASAACVVGPQVDTM